MAASSLREVPLSLAETATKTPASHHEPGTHLHGSFIISMEFHSSGEETRVPESDRITRRCSGVSENLTNKETDRIHMVSKLLGGMERVCEAVSRSSRPRGKKNKKQDMFRRTCFSLHHINIAAPVKLVFKTILCF